MLEQLRASNRRAELSYKREELARLRRDLTSESEVEEPVARIVAAVRDSLEKLKNLPVVTPHGQQIPLRAVASSGNLLPPADGRQDVVMRTDRAGLRIEQPKRRFDRPVVPGRLEEVLAASAASDRQVGVIALSITSTSLLPCVYASPNPSRSASCAKTQ